jgi:membrane protein
MADATRLRERPVGELLGAFTHETTTLLSQEMELARAEVGLQVNRATKGAAFFGVAAALAIAGLGALTACAVLALALVMDSWLAALIVGAALVIVAGIAAAIGKSRLKAVAPPVPERAMAGVRRDLEVVQEGVQAGRESNGGGGQHGA